MQMIEVMKRLAELDSANGIKESTQLINDPKLATITESGIAECGPMGMVQDIGSMGGSAHPASFSINATAGSGDEVANMLTQIMTLAGVKGGSEHPEMGEHPLTGEPPEEGPGNDGDMRAALDAIDQASGMGGMEDEDASAPDFEPATMGTAGPAGGDVSAMADQVSDMADELAGKDKEDLGLESLRHFDNSPQEQTREYNPNDFANILNKVREFDQVPARGGDNPLKAESIQSTEQAVKESQKETSLLDITTSLFKEYQAYKQQ